MSRIQIDSEGKRPVKVVAQGENVDDLAHALELIRKLLPILTALRGGGAV